MPIGCSDDGSLHWTDYPADPVDPADPAAVKNWFKNHAKIDQNMSQIDSKIIRKSTKMCPKSVYEALGEGLGGILGGLWGGLGAKSAPRWFQDPQSESFDPLLAAILEAKIDQKSILRIS